MPVRLKEALVDVSRGFVGASRSSDWAMSDCFVRHTNPRPRPAMKSAKTVTKVTSRQLARDAPMRQLRVTAPRR